MFTAFLVDDDALILEEMIQFVTWMDNGFEVIGSELNPEAAVEKIFEMQPDTVFCDLKMSGLDGNQLIAAIRERGYQGQFVMISAYDTFMDVRTFFMQEGFDYILKPVRKDEMQLVLERLAKRLSMTKKPELPVLETPGANPAFIRLTQYLNEHYYEKITLEDLSIHFNLSKNYICNLFTRHYNTTLTCFITDLRMKSAAALLKDKTRLMKEIAFLCGYSSYVHFFKVFREYYGISPKQMRESGE
ncbi:MAG: response regulator [Thermoclostridium sp.]|jgi:two-component system response regulator YesN|nr:response regulator [Thermoclostridium sp.]